MLLLSRTGPNLLRAALDFLLTTKTYKGRNGLSLKVNGLEKGYNDLAIEK